MPKRPSYVEMSYVYLYVVARDFGFAPNPFHGICTLATCKQKIRGVATVNDWVIGMGGSRLNAMGRCIFAMNVTCKITFNEYWNNLSYRDKKPVRNGSKVMMLGDNIYHFDEASSLWQQEDSHHSNPDGTVNSINLNRDTSANAVLVSNRFYYFGKDAPSVPPDILQKIPYANRIGHVKRTSDACAELLAWLRKNFLPNKVLADPFDFDNSQARYSGEGNKIVH